MSPLIPLTIDTSAPGKLILLGEHAVLYGQPAVVCAVNQSIHVSLTPRQDQVITIQSALGHHQTTIEQLTIEKPFQFILAALLYYQNELSQGFDLTVTSEFSDQVGFGSSAAVTVATLKAVRQWLGLSIDQPTFFTIAKQIVQQVQGGVGSGLDLAAALCGGTVYFDPTTQQMIPLPHNPPLTVIYSGYKTPTTEVIRLVTERFSQDKVTFQTLCQQMGDLSRQAKGAIEQADWITLGSLLNAGQRIMDQFRVNDPTLQKIVDELIQTPGIYGAKISGSGLGDCVVGIGQTDVSFHPPIKVLKVSVASNNP
jgi:mevalonate kinase